MAWLRAFGRFWYDFLVGDRWELFVGPIAALALAWLLVGGHTPGAVVAAVLFMSVATVGAISVTLSIRG